MIFSELTKSVMNTRYGADIHNETRWLPTVSIHIPNVPKALCFQVKSKLERNMIMEKYISSQVIDGLLLSSLLHNWRYCFNIFLVMFSNRCSSCDVMMLKNCVTNQRKIFLKFWNKIFHKPLDKLPKGWISDKKRRESGSHSVVDPLLTSNRLEK